MAEKKNEQKTPSKSSTFLGCGCLTFIIIILFGGCAALFGSGDEEVTEENNQEEVLEESEETEEPTEVEESEPEEEPVPEEDTNEEDNEVAGEVEEVEEDLTPEEEIESIINETIESERITELNINEYEGNYEIDMVFEASENFSSNMIANGIRRDMIDATLDLQGSDHYISYLLFTATLPLTDDAGNESPGQVMSASFNGETIQELNADNEIFLYDNIENVADGFSAHPEFR